MGFKRKAMIRKRLLPIILSMILMVSCSSFMGGWHFSGKNCDTGKPDNHQEKSYEENALQRQERLPLSMIIAASVTIICILIASKRKKRHGSEKSKPESEPELKKELSSKNKDFQILNNLYVPFGRGKTTEIDALMIHDIGIFVLEHKDYSGWIYGNAKEDNWTYRHYTKTHSFYNPIMQNQGHIRALRKYLSDSVIPMFNIVVFSDSCNIVEITNASEVDAEVINMKDLAGTVNIIIRKYRETISKASNRRKKKYYSELLKCANAPESVRKEHLEYIESKYGQEH